MLGERYAPNRGSSLVGALRGPIKIFVLLLGAVAVASLAVFGIRLARCPSRRGRRAEIAETTWSVAWDAWRATRGGLPALLARQQARLADLVDFARACSPYYRALYSHLPLDVTDVHQLPPVTKGELMAHFDDWVTDPAVTRTSVEAFVADKSLIGQPYLGHYLVWTTSGSTGVPAILVQNQASLAVTVGLSFARGVLAWITPRDLWRFLRRGIRGAVLLATGSHFGGVVMVEYRRRTFPRWAGTVRIFSVLSPLPALVDALNAFQPTILGGYATAVALLAREQQAGKLRIDPVMVSTTAEWLASTARKQIEETFGCPVWNGYASSEAPAIAFDCGHGWMHVNADWFVLEPVDEAYRPVPPGQPSHTVLVTNLANRMQPIIRYDQGDSVTVSPDPCPCGSPLPAIRVEGRTDEILSFPTPSGEMVHLLPMALATVVEETPGVHRFQVIQRGTTRLDVRLEVAAMAERTRVWDAVNERMRAYLAAQGLSAVTVQRAVEPPLRDTKSGKFRHVWSEPELMRADSH